MTREPSNRLGRVLDGYAAHTVPDDANIWPSIAARLGADVPKRSEAGRRETWRSFAPAARPGWRISLALLSVVLAAVTVVVAYWNLSTQDVADSVGTITPEEIEAQVDEYVHRGGQFSGVALIARNGEVVFHKGYGMANYEDGIPNSPDTIFPLPSFRDHFTAMAVLQLYERGLVDPQESITTYVPNYSTGAGVTVHQLLTRTGGTPSPLSGMSEEEIRAARSMSFEKFVDLLSGMGTVEPDWGAGLDYVLLIRLVELVSGQAYEEYLREHIFSPLKMDHTSYCDLEDQSRGRAIGYENDLTRADIDLYTLNSVEGPHGFGSLCSTAEDLFRWGQGLVPGVLLSADTLDKWFSAYVTLEANSLDNYGYGVFVPDPDHEDRRSIVAPGMGPGSAVLVRWFPDDEILVVVLRNVSDPGVWRSWVSSGLMADIVQSDALPGTSQKTYEGTVEEVESLLSGALLERYRSLPVDYQKALAAYLEFGVSADLILTLVEQRMAQWPAEPEPLIDLLGAEGYQRFQQLDRHDVSFRYHAFFLLTVYTWAHATEPTFEGRRQAVVNLLDALDPFQDPESVDTTDAEAASSPGSVEGVEPKPSYIRPRDESRVEWLSLESVLTPAALAKLRQLGPDFQRAVEAHVGRDYDFQTFAIMATGIEIGLLKAPVGMELPPIEDYLTEEQLTQLNSIPQDIRETVEPGFHRGLADGLLVSALDPKYTIELPPEDHLRNVATSDVELALLKDRTRPDGN